MAEKFYHKTIKKNIIAIGKLSKRYQIHVEENIPLTHKHLPLMFFYKPEVHFETKIGKLYIFEIFDDQINKPNLIIADIIQSYVVPNVSKVLFIVKSKGDETKVYALSKVIGERLKIMGVKKLPQVTTYIISKKEARSQRIFNILKKFSRKDGWN